MPSGHPKQRSEQWHLPSLSAISRIPSIFYGFYRLVSPFVDPVTKDKIRFNPDCRTLVPPSQLDKLAFGGDFNFEYQHDSYFPFMHEIAKKRREENLARWRQYGGNKCGLSEFIIKGGMQNERTSDDFEREQAAAGTAVNGAQAATSSLVAGQANEKGASSENSSTSAPTPAVSQSVATSGANSLTELEAAANKAAGDEHHSLERNNVESKKPQSLDAKLLNGGSSAARVSSADSFVTSKETLSPPIATTSGRDNDVDRFDAATKSNKAPNGSGEAGLETGIAGLVIKEDGSLGAA